MIRASIVAITHTAIAVALGATSAAAQSWQSLSPANAPSPRNGATMAFDEATGIGVLFGGYDATTPGFGDTWLWNGSAWTSAAPAHAPSARWGHAMVFDSVRRRVVLFGGFDPVAGLRFDTWEWDGVDWTDRTAGTRPPGRSNHSLAFDRRRGVTMLFGGGGNGGATLYNDVWNWNGVQWTYVPPQPSGWPTPRWRATMVHDEQRGETVLFGGADASGVQGDTWVWDGAGWAARTPTVAPAARQSAAAWFDPVRATVVVAGGAGAGFVQNYGDCWEWNGGVWHQHIGGPAARHGASVAYDQRTRSGLMFGGRSGTGFSADTWRLTSEDWNSVPVWMQSGNDLPFRRSGIAMAYDAARGEVVVHGGLSVSGPPPWSPGGSYVYGTYRETYRLTPNGWSLAALGPTRTGAAMVFDTTRSRCVLFGGYETQQGGFSSYYGDTWSWNGVAWSQIATAGPSARSDYALAYDAARDRVVLFGGSSGSDETWEFDGAVWTQRVTVNSPSPRLQSAMAFEGIGNPS